MLFDQVTFMFREQNCLHVLYINIFTTKFAKKVIRILACQEYLILVCTPTYRPPEKSISNFNSPNVPDLNFSWKMFYVKSSLR